MVKPQEEGPSHEQAQAEGHRPEEDTEKEFSNAVPRHPAAASSRHKILHKTSLMFNIITIAWSEVVSYPPIGTSAGCIELPIACFLTRGGVHAGAATARLTSARAAIPSTTTGRCSRRGRTS